MKTKIRSLIIICTLGLAGTLNGNATLSYKTSCIAGTQEEEKNVKSGLINADESNSALNQETASFAGESKSENQNSVEYLLNEDADAEIDYLKEAQLVTKWVVDKEEAKAIQKLIDKNIFVSNDQTASLASKSKSENQNSVESLLNEGIEAKMDLLKEAQLVTKLVVDNEEAKVIQKLIDEGKLPENK